MAGAGDRVTANLPAMAEVFADLRRAQPEAVGVLAAASEELAKSIRELAPGIPVVIGSVDAVIAWADLCLAVSGTVTLDIARHCTPMIGLYRTTAFSVFASRFLLRTPHRLLPNIVAGRRIVPEFVPYSGGSAPIAAAARQLLSSPDELEQQRSDLEALVCKPYDGMQPDRESAEAILEVLQGGAQ